MQEKTSENASDFVAQKRPAKSEKQQLVRRISRLVRQAGLDYRDWRYVARRVRERCDLRPAGKRAKRLPHIPTEDELRRFLRAVDRANDPQHGLMIRLMLLSGVRISELCRLEIPDIDLDRRTVRVRRGKGRKDRITLFPEWFAPALRTHISAHPKHRWFFQTRRSSRFTPRRVQQIVQGYARQAGIQITPHTFRHIMLTRLAQSGMPDAQTQLLSGHARRDTLTIYQHLAVDGPLAAAYERAMRPDEHAA